MRKLPLVLLAAVALSVPTVRANRVSTESTNVRLEIVSSRIIHDNIRDRREVTVIAELKNVGSSIVADIDGYIDLYDGAHWVETNYAVFIYLDHLRPGDTTPVYTWSVEIPAENTIDRLVWHLSGRATTESPYDPPIATSLREEHSAGYLELIGEVENVGSENFILEGFFATFYDDAGRITGIHVSWATAWDVGWIVVPGTKYPFSLTCGFPTYVAWPASWKVQVGAYPTSAYPLPLEFSDVSEARDQDGRTHITGDLRNPNPISTGNIMILAVLRDAGGEVVEYSREYLDALSPGESVDFDVRFYDSSITHASYELQAQCEGTSEDPVPSQTPTATPTATATSTSTPEARLTATPTDTVSPTNTPTHTSVPWVRVLLPCILKMSRGGS